MAASEPVYDRIGGGYVGGRRADPRIAAVLTVALGDADRVLNIGAGTGSYEPGDRRVMAVDPSLVMLAQRPAVLRWRCSPSTTGETSAGAWPRCAGSPAVIARP